MAENAPYEEEEKLEDSVDEEMLALLLLALLDATDLIVFSRFTDPDFDNVQAKFRDVSSRSLPTLSSVSQEAIEVGIQRTMRETDLKDLSVDHTDEAIQNHIRAVLSSHLSQVEETNERAFRRLRELASENQWSDQEVARRLKRYFGLIPSHIDTVINMETSLLREGASKKVVDKQVQTKIDQLIEWRMKLVAANVATDIVEGSKSVAFRRLYELGSIDGNYVKQWVSVVDSKTSDICMSSNRMVTEINAPFANGFQYPPAHGHCRSSIRLIKRN